SSGGASRSWDCGCGGGRGRGWHRRGFGKCSRGVLRGEGVLYMSPLKDNGSWLRWASHAVCFASAVIFGGWVGAVLPTVDLYFLYSVFPSFAKNASQYFGGYGVSFFVIGGAFALGAMSRIAFSWFSGRAIDRWDAQDLIVAFVYFFAGLFL